MADGRAEKPGSRGRNGKHPKAQAVWITTGSIYPNFKLSALILAVFDLRLSSLKTRGERVSHSVEPSLGSTAKFS